jgi:hypothetical protein
MCRASLQHEIAMKSQSGPAPSTTSSESLKPSKELLVSLKSMTTKLSELAAEEKAAVEALQEAELYHHYVEHILQNASQLSTDLETRLTAAKPPVQAPEETHWVPVTARCSIYRRQISVPCWPVECSSVHP